VALPSRLFCHTSFFRAALDPSDANHRRARVLTEEAAAARVVLLATWDIVSDTVTLLRDRRSFQAALDFLEHVKPQLQLVVYGDRIRVEAEEVFRRVRRDHRLSFCDAISFVVVTTLLDHVACLTFDEGFRSLGLTTVA
jgi:predicted nucleic acid-binding protein